MTTYYKFLSTGGVAPYSGWQWPLPTKNEDGTWTPGEWTPAVDELIECERGYHVTGTADAIEWLGAEMYAVESHPEAVFAQYDNKGAFTQCRLVRQIERWDERTQRVFACDCAERALGIFERACPDDNRPRNVIETARRYARGEATLDELVAAGAAARAAAGAAAWAAARNAAWYAARAVARAAAEDAAEDAAWVAARAAAGAAERGWQTQHLCELLGIE